MHSLAVATREAGRRATLPLTASQPERDRKNKDRRVHVVTRPAGENRFLTQRRIITGVSETAPLLHPVRGQPRFFAFGKGILFTYYASLPVILTSKVEW